MFTNTEENYLKTIFKLSQEQKAGITTNAIAAVLNTKASSVTDMLQKMADKHLVNYKKYQGVTLTSEGERNAIFVIRKHRLWEVFLYRHMGYRWDEIHDIAEELEHISSESLIERLDKFLDYPRTDPHGDPIPDTGGLFPVENSTLLSKVKANGKGLVSGVNDKSSSFLAYLNKIGIQLGSELEIIEWHDFDHSADVLINGNSKVHLSYQAVQNILIHSNE